MGRTRGGGEGVVDEEEEGEGGEREGPEEEEEEEDDDPGVERGVREILLMIHGESGVFASPEKDVT